MPRTQPIDLNDPDVQAALAMADTIFRTNMPTGKHNKGVKIENTNLMITPIPTGGKVHAKVQEIGAKHGCWTCGKKMGDPGTGNWVADHIPPFRLAASAIDLFNAAFNTDFKYKKYVLYPSCVNCSRKQSSLVKRVARKPKLIPDLSGKALAMFIGGDYAAKGVKTTLRTTLKAHVVWKSMAGLKCHICGAKHPVHESTKYTADHYPPREFNTNYAREVFRLAGVKVPGAHVRPQCITCSGAQASLNSASQKLQAIAKLLNVTVYKS